MPSQRQREKIREQSVSQWSYVLSFRIHQASIPTEKPREEKAENPGVGDFGHFYPWPHVGILFPPHEASVLHASLAASLLFQDAHLSDQATNL